MHLLVEWLNICSQIRWGLLKARDKEAAASGENDTRKTKQAIRSENLISLPWLPALATDG